MGLEVRTFVRLICISTVALQVGCSHTQGEKLTGWTGSPIVNPELPDLPDSMATVSIGNTSCYATFIAPS